MIAEMRLDGDDTVVVMLNTDSRSRKEKLNGVVIKHAWDCEKKRLCMQPMIAKSTIQTRSLNMPPSQVAFSLVSLPFKGSAPQF
jgi:hypothetical protein